MRPRLGKMRLIWAICTKSGQTCSRIVKKNSIMVSLDVIMIYRQQIEWPTENSEGKTTAELPLVAKWTTAELQQNYHQWQSGLLEEVLSLIGSLASPNFRGITTHWESLYFENNTIYPLPPLPQPAAKIELPVPGSACHADKCQWSENDKSSTAVQIQAWIQLPNFMWWY